MIQVISGTFRGRSLTSPKGGLTRPTTSQVRQAVFNICQHQIDGARFIDICAGSGSMGIEAISRGASHATFIDHNRYAIMAIRDNIKTLEIEASCDVIVGDVLLSLKKLEKKQKTFDICYFDPPYSRDNQNSPFVESVLQFLDSGLLMHPGALLFVEESAHFDVEKIVLKSISLQSKRRFGDANLFTFVKT